ncbi:MAG TPA: TIGR03960 family B12-binding radical SAM protein [Desulfonatronum sp.]|nr:TIGR03960 family B12-binding radical SAM protein [Desulfonatronum sp.]
MHHLLPLLPRPSQYLGTEPNSVHKNPAEVLVRVGLAFPDLYEVGMSYLGGRILYHQVNAHPRFWAERVFAPPREASQVLRDSGTFLGTLESGTPLRKLDVVAFSLTHELCYSNVLYMLDLAGIARRAALRDCGDPLIIGGGGVVFNAEPMAPFFDVLVAGDGEEVLPELLEVAGTCKNEGRSREELLRAISRITGCYVPAFFVAGSTQSVRPVFADYALVEKRIVTDLNQVAFPSEQVVPFGPVVHDRLSIEIARGCTRGCRFCQAGMIYRPVRERSLDALEVITSHGLEQTGFDELSFLSLSTGDYSCLEELFADSFHLCRQRQVSISLPSLRVGSVSGQILDRIATIRRTGITLAPEAGSQRLRDVINKNITEEALLNHTSELFDRGWSSVKLYFMIGLPTETDEDLLAIVDLCLKVAATAGAKAKRLQITAAISPFVPKPHTPFQWEGQMSLEETGHRLNRLKDLFRPHKHLSIRWHMPEMSFLEGVFSRGDRALAEVVERACDKGAMFSSWSDSLELPLWLEAFRECGLEPERYLRPRDPDGPLPWDHIFSGVRREFLLRERRLALAMQTTPDCRKGQCMGCGVCTTTGVPTALKEQASLDIRPRLSQYPKRDHERSKALDPADTSEDNLAFKAVTLRVAYRKLGPAVYFSQLELTKLFERAMRRAGMPISFSQGFHPMPRMSFGRALPVGVGSVREEMVVVLRQVWNAAEVFRALGEQTPLGLELLDVAAVPSGSRAAQPSYEEYLLQYFVTGQRATQWQENWRSFCAANMVDFHKKTKRGARQINIRGLFRDIRFLGQRRLRLIFDFREEYLNPWAAVQAVTPGLSFDQARLTKIRSFEET